MSYEPKHNCALCPRLSAFRKTLRQTYPDFYNAPVPCFGHPETAKLLIVGLAPGLRGANRTGRVFTGDGAGLLLYQTLLKQGLAKGQYHARIDDSLRLVNLLITNAVRCVPPDNQPLASEIKTCRPFLQALIQSMPKLKVIIALGHIAHQSILAALDLAKSDYPFKHNRAHQLGSAVLLDSYHCSRRNISTKILTPGQFTKIFKKAQKYLTP